jgi:Ribbon-helix-helix protein, copG family
LEEVSEPIFAPASAINVRLPSREAKAIRDLAQSKRVSQEELIREWVLQKLARRKSSRPLKR